VATLEQLLEVHERVSLEQARRLESALAAQTEARLRLEEQTDELEMQAEELQNQAAQLQEAQAELELTNATLERANEQLERVIASRSRFYASMSHELRTPINAILGYTDLLLGGVYGELPDEQREGVERTLRAGRHLHELVNDILDLSKIEAGKLEMEAARVELPELITDLYASMRPLAEERGSTLDFSCDEPPEALETDPRRVRQILLNLLSNALKFGGGKPVTVRCMAGEGGSGVVEVSDQGAGIAPEDLPQIFEEFVQLGRGHREGTGLGLPISRRLAERLEGTLEVESTPGEGSTFRLTLPPAPSWAAEARRETASRTGAAP
jgi:signal transduction histidine kinase